MIYSKDSLANNRTAYIRYVLSYLAENMDILENKKFYDVDVFKRREKNFKWFTKTSKRKFYNAFNLKTTPEDETLQEIQVAFDIPLEFGQFEVKLKNKNPRYTKFLQQETKIPPWETSSQLPREEKNIIIHDQRKNGDNEFSEEKESKQKGTDRITLENLNAVNYRNIRRSKSVKLMGVIRSIAEKEYHVTEKFGEQMVNKNPFQITKLQFEIKHQVSGQPFQHKDCIQKVEINNYNTDGSFRSKSIDEMDDKCNPIYSVSYDANGEVTRKNICSYDKSGLIIKETDYEKKHRNTITEFEYKYNKEGRIIQRIWCTRGMIEDVKIDGAKTYYYKYDKMGRVKQRNTNYGEKNVFCYDMKSNLIKELHYTERGLEIQSELDYYENGYIRKDINIGGLGQPFEYESCSYFSWDELGNLTDFSYYLSNTKEKKQSIIVNEYKYDRFKNWIGRHTYRDGILDQITEREITYAND